MPNGQNPQVFFPYSKQGIKVLSPAHSAGGEYNQRRVPDFSDRVNTHDKEYIWVLLQFNTYMNHAQDASPTSYAASVTQ